jgi:hypothetical protein
MVPDIEALVREVTRTHAGAFTPSPELPQRVMRRTRQRARRRRVAALGAAAGLAVALAVGVPLSLRDQGRRDVRVATQPTPSTAPPTPTSAVLPHFRASPPAPVDVNAPEPATFIGGIGGGHEREAVVSSTTGAVLRYLSPPPGSQTLPRISSDGRTLYKSELAGCGRSWTAVDIATGASRPVFTDLADTVDVAPSPDGQKLALVRLSGKPGQGCRGVELVVREVSSGRERVWKGLADSNIVQLRWSFDSAQLAYELAGPGARVEPHLLDINAGTSVTDGIVLQAPDAGCTLTLPRFRAGTEDVVLAQNCPRKAELLDFDRGTGALVARTLLASDDLFGVTDLAIDASGRHVIYVLSYYGPKPARVFVLRGQGPVAVRADCFYVFW